MRVDACIGRVILRSMLIYIHNFVSERVQHVYICCTHSDPKLHTLGNDHWLGMNAYAYARMWLRAKRVRVFLVSSGPSSPSGTIPSPSNQILKTQVDRWIDIVACLTRMSHMRPEDIDGVAHVASFTHQFMIDDVSHVSHCSDTDWET